MTVFAPQKMQVVFLQLFIPPHLPPSLTPFLLPRIPPFLPPLSLPPALLPCLPSLSCLLLLSLPCQRVFMPSRLFKIPNEMRKGVRRINPMEGRGEKRERKGRMLREAASAAQTAEETRARRQRTDVLVAMKRIAAVCRLSEIESVHPPAAEGRFSADQTRTLHHISGLPVASFSHHSIHQTPSLHLSVSAPWLQ